MPPVNVQLSDDWIRHAILLERFKDGEVRRIVDLIRKQVEPSILAKAQRIGERYEKMGASKLAVARRRRALMKQLREMQAIATGGSNLLYARLKGSMADLAKSEAAWAARTMQRRLPLRANYTAPSPELLRSLITTRPMQGRFLRDWAKSVGQNTAKNVNAAIMNGVAQGEGVDTIVRRLRGTAKAGFKDGVLHATRAEAQMVTRTAVNHFGQAAREAVFEQNPDVVEKVEWTSVLDSRTSQICASMDGRTYTINNGPRPPAHPNCRSVMVPVVKPPQGIPGIDASKLPVGERASMAGPVPANRSFGPWLKTQSKKTQNQILGKGKADLFRRGKVPIEKFSDIYANYAVRPLTLPELEAIEKGVTKKAATKAAKKASKKVAKKVAKPKPAPTPTPKPAPKPPPPPKPKPLSTPPPKFQTPPPAKPSIPPKPKPAPKPTPAPVVDPVAEFTNKHGYRPVHDASDWTQVGPQAGSNPGGLYERTVGGVKERFYVKQVKSGEHAMNEVAAAKLYEQAGVKVAQVELGMMNGKPVVISRWEPLQKFSLTAQNIAAAQQGFAVDALLANWDVMGATFDNIFVTATGQVMRLDTGGAMLYRAQGGLKGTAWNDKVGEFLSLRNKVNAPQASQVFGAMTDRDLYQSISNAVSLLDNQKIANVMFDVYSATNASRKQGYALGKMLQARRAKLIAIRDKLGDKIVAQQEAAKAAAAAAKKTTKKATKKATKKGAGTGREAAGPTPSIGRNEALLDREYGSFHTKRKRYTDEATYQKDWNAWVKSLSLKERDALDSWTGGEYGRIRGAQGFNTSTVFRFGDASGQISRYAEVSKLLRDAMQRAPMPKPVKLHRSFYVRDRATYDKILKTARAGDDWTMEATASFSTSDDVATGFARVGDKNVRLTVKTNRGTWVDPISENQGELEHIMMNGEKFRIVEIRKWEGPRGKKTGIEVILEER